jgi:anti-anti-sigma regulatory factor
MFDMDLSRESEIAVLRLIGTLDGLGDTDRLHEAFAFVQPDDHLLLDLTEATTIDAFAALTLRDILAVRSIVAETVIVSPVDTVSMHLVLHDVDRVSPIVPSVDEALAILDSRWAGRRHAR